MQRKRGYERRRDIVHAVLNVIGTQGVTALTTATLARQVGVTTGALFRHFATLDDVMKETVRYALAEIDNTFPDASAPPLERLFGLARNRVALFRRDPGLSWLVRSEQACLMLPDEAVASLRALVQRSRRFLLDALRDAVAEGSIRDDIEPEILIVPVMGTIHALAGMSGVHRLTERGGAKRTDDVLAGLERMLAMPQSTKSTKSAKSTGRK